ncbi:MAG: GNAT family protein [Sulfobacillus thermotolerans]|nr:GNAT family protein [Sulfobacillus thermotolerans]
MDELTYPTWGVRPASTEDAPQMLTYMENLAQEPDLLLPMVAEDFRLTVADEASMIARHEARDNALALIAVAAAGQVVGMWDCMGSTRPALQHAVEFGMSVAREYRGQGVGAALLSAGLDWARQSPTVHRVELEVYVENRSAIRLYEKFGFTIEGRKRHAFYQHGRYHDSLIMALLLHQ